MSKKPKPLPGTLTTRATPWRDIAFICRQCTRKLDGGFGEHGDQTLRQALREALRRRHRRGEIALMEVGCLGICPKGAVTMGFGNRPSELVVVARKTEIDTILDRACLSDAPQG